jgi:catechol 2,3-dioxygenase-like lactoylglutathione lyase family enzyme
VDRPRIRHVDLVVSDLERGLRFYRGLLGPLGWERERVVAGERGEPIHYLFGEETGSVGVREAPGDPGLPVDRYRVGMHHVCFGGGTRADVDAAAGRIAELGGTVSEGPQGYPEYYPDYYAVFGFDPDGIKIEVTVRA